MKILDKILRILITILDIALVIGAGIGIPLWVIVVICLGR